MNKFITKISLKFRNKRRENYYNRLNWESFLTRLETAFKNFNKVDNLQYIGNFYFSTNAHEYEKHILSSQRINQAQITFGITTLPYHTLNSTDNSKYKRGIEKGASIVFSQFANGKISVFLYPQESELMKEKKEWLLLAWNRNPNHLTERKIEKYIMIYLKHIYATSIDSAFDCSNYIHRTKLSIRHAILTGFQEFRISQFIVGLFTVIGAITAVMALLVQLSTQS